MPDQINLRDKSKENTIILNRVIASAIIVAALTTALVTRLYFLQVIQHDYQISISDKNRIRFRAIPPARGIIYDRNMVVLASNQPCFNLLFTREQAADTTSVINEIVRILNLPLIEKENLQKKLSRTNKAFEPVTLLEDLTESQIALIAVNQYMLPGVEVQPQFLREYPFGAHFAHSVGYVGQINEKEIKTLNTAEYRGSNLIGKTGIERFYESALHGRAGYDEVETNAQGRIIRILHRQNPVPGKNIVLTLDAKLQSVAEEALGERRGAVVALDPNTGEVLAMVSQPSFDPNPFVKGISLTKYAELRDSDDMPLFNRTLRGLYPPASTIKPMVLIAGLDSGATTPTDKVFDPGYYEFPNYKHKYRNWNRWGDGWVNMYDAIVRSNDTYFYDLAHKLGIKKLNRYLVEFGLGHKISVDMFEEAAGLMPSPEWKRATRRQEWFPGETLILGIGQGYMQVTPLQLAQATSLIASKGIWHRPHLALTIGDEIQNDPSPAPNITLKDPKIWDQVTQSMQMAVSNSRGVSRSAAIGTKYSMAGKSGTAQVVAIKQGERYNRNTIRARHRDNALFIGFAPAQRPAIVVAAVIENGEAGARVAGPVVRKVMDAWLLGADGNVKPQFLERASTVKTTIPTSQQTPS
ncbi:penicillin-binding protein 2 [Pseudomonas tolaasii]